MLLVIRRLLREGIPLPIQTIDSLVSTFVSYPLQKLAFSLML